MFSNLNNVSTSFFLVDSIAACNTALVNMRFTSCHFHEEWLLWIVLK